MHLPLLVLVAGLALSTGELPASPLLRSDHWAVKAAERLHEVGLLPEWLPAQRAAPLAAVARALAVASERAGQGVPRYAPIARAWAERFAAEFPGSGALVAPGYGGGPWQPALLGASAAIGYAAGSTHEAPSASPVPPAALRLEPVESAPFAEGGAAGSYGPHLAAGLAAHATPWRVDLSSVELVGALGPVALSVGRAPVGYGPNEVGAVVASGRAAVDRVELMTIVPVRLPGMLGFMGEFALDTALARFSDARHPYHPLLWEFELQWRPHSRLTLAAIRGVMFGGTLWEGIPAHDAPLALLGIKNYRENNVYSGSIEYLLPTEALLPLTAKLEWGTDDNPGAAFSWPGLVVGLSAPMLPGLPVALGIEYAYFGRGPFGYHDPFAWYSHGQYTGGWATGETALGDPLGGNGRALRLTAAADPWNGRVRLAGRGWVQERFADNLYAPAAGGRSAGVQGEAEWRWGRAAVAARGGYERGSQGWNRGEAGVLGRVFF